MESEVANTDRDCNVLDVSECNEQVYSVIHLEELCVIICSEEEK
jgi:hypothetical protein